MEPADDTGLRARWNGLATTGSRWPAAEAWLWIAGIGFQLLYRLALFFPDFDHTILLVVARNVIDGYGPATVSASLADLSSAQFHRTAYWPPGWAFLAIPFLLVLSDVFWALFASEAASLLLLNGAAIVMVRRLGPSLTGRARLLLIAVLTMIAFPHGNFTFGTAWSVALFMAATALVLPAGERELAPWRFFASGCLVAAALWMRYQYAFVAFAILAVLTVQLRGGKSKRLRLALHAAGLLLLLAPFLFWRFGYVRTTNVAEFDERMSAGPSVHFENLLRTPPAGGVAMFGDAWSRNLLDPVLPRSLSLASRRAVTGAFGWFLTLAAIAGAFLAIRSVRGRDGAGGPAVRRFYAVGAAAIVLNAALLAYISVLKPIGEVRWVHIEVPRYHVIGAVFILTGLVHFLAASTRIAGALVKSVIVAGLLFAVVLRSASAVSAALSLASGQWGPPLEERFFYQGPSLVRFLALREHSTQPNVFVYVGRRSNDASYKSAQAQLSRFSAAIVADPSAMKTSRPVNLVAVIRRDAPDWQKERFEKLCARLGPVVPVASDIVGCHGTFTGRGG